MSSEPKILGRAASVMVPETLAGERVSAVQSHGDTAADRWRQWQLRNVETNRKDARRMRIVFTALFAALATWLGVQLFVPSLLP